MRTCHLIKYMCFDYTLNSDSVEWSDRFNGDDYKGTNLTDLVEKYVEHLKKSVNGHDAVEPTWQLGFYLIDQAVKYSRIDFKYNPETQTMNGPGFSENGSLCEIFTKALDHFKEKYPSYVVTPSMFVQVGFYSGTRDVVVATKTNDVPKPEQEPTDSDDDAAGAHGLFPDSDDDSVVAPGLFPDSSDDDW